MLNKVRFRIDVLEQSSGWVFLTWKSSFDEAFELTEEVHPQHDDIRIVRVTEEIL